jgi:DNA-binding IclR family transcriptional regulator
LGHHAARAYQALTTTPAELADLIGRTGYSRSRLSRLLDRLATHHLARTDRRGRWQLRGRNHTSGTRLGRAARTLEVLGVLTDRARRYAIERAAWAWWTDELAWRRAPAAVKQRAPGAGQLELVPTVGGRVRNHHGRHPVDHRGRADYSAALAHLAQARGGRRQAS